MIISRAASANNIIMEEVKKYNLTAIPTYKGKIDKENFHVPVDTTQMDKWIEANMSKTPDDRYPTDGMKRKLLKRLYYEHNKMGAYSGEYDDILGLENPKEENNPMTDQKIILLALQTLPIDHFLKSNPRTAEIEEMIKSGKHVAINDKGVCMIQDSTDIVIESKEEAEKEHKIVSEVKLLGIAQDALKDGRIRKGQVAYNDVTYVSYLGNGQYQISVGRGIGHYMMELYKKELEKLLEYGKAQTVFDIKVQMSREYKPVELEETKMESFEFGEFETGAQTAEVNNIALYIDNTQALSKEKEDIFESSKSYDEAAEKTARLLESAEKQYKKEIGEDLGLSKEQRVEYVELTMKTETLPF